MTGKAMTGKALIVGAGDGLSASFARKLASAGWNVALAARRPERLALLAGEIGATWHGCDASDPAQVTALFEAAGPLDLVHYNPSFRVRGPIATLDPEAVRQTLAVTAFGGFLVAQQAARLFLAQGHGTIVLTGASASVKGYAQSAPFAMGKFALRGLAQSLARELHPQGVRVLHVVVDGGIRSAHRPALEGAPDALLDPDAIAETMLALIAQPRSVWTDEVAVRPWVEKF